MFEEQDKKTAEEWRPTSERTEAIHYILAVTDCPKQVRHLIDILVGISYGFPEFETTQSDIAGRISGGILTSVDKNAKQWVKRAHRELRKWQTGNQLTLVEYEPGSRSKDKTRHYKSRYRLQIIGFADDVIKLAQKNPLWDKNKPQAIEGAAIKLKPQYWPIDVMYHRGRRTPAASSVIRKHLSSSVSYMKKALAMLDKDNTIILIDDEVIEDFERTLKELKERRLSEDFFLRKVNKQP